MEICCSLKMKTDEESYSVKNNLRQLLEQCKTNIKVAVVLSCHSEFIGEIFYKAGIQHVISIKEEYKISDEASIKFASTFYKYLFTMNNYSICEAFNAAKSAVELAAGRAGIQPGEYTKFVLKSNHNVKRCPPKELYLQPGKKKCLNNVPLIKKLPAEVENFVGRQHECKIIIEKLHENRYISVEGPAGVGKSAIIKRVANLLYERSYMKDGILYLSLKDCNSMEALFKKMYLSMKFFINNKEIFENSHDKEIPEAEQLYWALLSIFKDLTCLIIFDNCNEPSKFKDFFQDFLEKIPGIKIIVTCIYSIARFDDVNNYIYKVKGLSKRQSLELLRVKAESSTDHMNQLKQLEKSLPGDVGVNKSVIDHPLFEMIGGHPLSIAILSSLRRNMSLQEIYELLQYSGTKTSALKLSIELSIMFVNKENKDYYDILLYFAASPSGLTHLDITDIMHEDEISFKSNLIRTKWEDLLVSCSLLQIKNIEFGKKNIDWYYMDLAISKIIQDRTDEEKLDEIYKRLLQKFTGLLSNALNNRFSQQESIVDLVLLYEGNIWNLIKRCHCKITGQQKKESYSDESDTPVKRENEDHFSGMLSPGKGAQRYTRSGTYRERKNTYLKKMFTRAESRVKNFDIHEDSKVKEEQREASPVDKEKNKEIKMSSIKAIIKGFVIDKLKQNEEKKVNISESTIVDEGKVEDIEMQSYTNEIIELSDIKMEIDQQKCDKITTLKDLVE